MQLLLWRWSISALAASIAMIAVFFAALWRSTRRPEMRWWTFAWVADACALAAALLYWYTEPPASLNAPIFGVYLAAKCAYVWFFLRGTHELRWPAPLPRLLHTNIGWTAIVVFAAVGTLFSTNLDRLGILESGVICVGLGVASVALMRSREFGASWLAVGFAAQSLLGAFECAAYAVNTLSAPGPNPNEFLSTAGTLLAVHTSFDTGAEWLIAMGCVIAVSARTQRALQQANVQLLLAQADMRRVADRDPLTALANRRTLPEVFRTVQPGGATVIFFDLDGFKRINDTHGHQFGDEYLKTFAAALADSFRPTDAIVRYGGDEFLVVASGLDESAVEERVDALRARLQSGLHGAPIRFSHGLGALPPGGQPDAALHAADDAMYRAKLGLSTDAHAARR